MLRGLAAFHVLVSPLWAPVWPGSALMGTDKEHIIGGGC
jgi:hypothetical protein